MGIEHPDGTEHRLESGFITGINYWPAAKAMYWWRDFDLQEVEHDFKQLAANRLNLVRIFLLWEDFQPEPGEVDAKQLTNMQRTADLAYKYGLHLMITFFCGHMSGVNWMPAWMLTRQTCKGRFPVFSRNRTSQFIIRNCYVDPDVISAQLLQIRLVAEALKNHPAVYAYDLGNEPSNWVVPPCREDGRNWLRTMTAEIKQYSGGIPVTMGMHAEDLEEDRRLGPADAAPYCDFLSMHGYPFYLEWVNEADDGDLVPFLGLVTTWLGGKPVLLQEFGAPARSDWDNQGASLQPWSEARAADYYQRVLQKLQRSGLMGAMAWCASDYAPSLWVKPPLDICPHERYFGLFHYDGTPKPAVKVWRQLNLPNIDLTVEEIIRKNDWLQEVNPDQFYLDPRNNLAKLYQQYKQWLKGR